MLILSKAALSSLMDRRMSWPEENGWVIQGQDEAHLSESSRLGFYNAAKKFAVLKSTAFS
jgi:hypothetical protein